jgi:hypothetical protein
MEHRKFMNTQSRNSIELLAWRCAFILITLTLVWLTFWPAPKLFGVVPAPDGGYPGGNTAEGQNALLSLTGGTYNTAVGFLSMEGVTIGSFNTAVGAGSLLVGVAAESTAIGAAALLSSSGGFGNTATGAFAMFSDTDGDFNTATGDSALYHNTTGSANTAVGFNALASNTIGSQNTAVGEEALLNNTGGGANTAIGYLSLRNMTDGAYNVAVAGGFNLQSGNFNIYIGNDGGDSSESGHIRIGSGCCQTRTNIAGIWGVTYPGQAAVYVNSDGALGVALSSARFKRDIHNMDKSSETLFALRPVQFRYKEEIDPRGVEQFGLVAEEVEKVDPDLVLHDPDGTPYTVRYEQINAMLLNEFLKEHKAFVEEQNKVEKLEATVAGLLTNVKEQAAQIQKVSTQFELQRSTPQKVVNSR